MLCVNRVLAWLNGTDYVQMLTTEMVLLSAIAFCAGATVARAFIPVALLWLATTAWLALSPDHFIVVYSVSEALGILWIARVFQQLRGRN